MTDFTPTPEQQACITAARDTEDNLLISALAGAAKTSTLVMIANALPDTNMLCLAFNKRIQLEMQQRLPPNCTSLTLNSLGHRIWADSTGRRLTLNKDKCIGHLRSLIDGLSKSEKEEAYDSFTEILRAVELGKTVGYIPSHHYLDAQALMQDEEFYDWLDEEPTDLQWDLIRKVSLYSLKQAWAGEIDFNDQILMPTVFRCIFPRYPLVLIDEAQDLSALNHAMLAKLAKGRLIAVGDECQSIYGFRGAHEDSMQLLRERFNMRTLTLSVSFRCPQAVVREAQWRAPHMRWPEWAKPGEVRHLTEWSADDIPNDSAIICRNNAPLFSMAIKLLKDGRAAEVVGNDIGRYLIRVMKKLGDASMTREAALAALADWKERKLRKSRNPGSVHDQADCIKLFLKQGNTLGQAIAYAEHIFAIAGPVKLMTGHKSKGLEFPHVFFLDEFLLRKDQQDLNLRYVIQTRAKETLTYVTSEAYVSSRDADDVSEGGGSTDEEDVED